MENEAKNAEKMSIGGDTLQFQQAEPAEINEAELRAVAGGAHADPLLPSV
jgi:hypothetical protein